MKLRQIEVDEEAVGRVARALCRSPSLPREAAYTLL
jgi:hypothetical protein